MDKIVIPLKGIPTLNEHDNANRANRFGGASMKKKATNLCATYIRKAINEGFVLKNEPTNFEFAWFVKDRRKDKDNISFAKKYIFDGMVKVGLIKNDGWREVGDWEESFEVDKEFERVEIYEILEEEK